MDWKGIFTAISKPDKNAATYELSTDFEYTGLQEYPRPQLQRDSYINLNGTWDYRVIGAQAKVVASGPIEVPFSPEAKLSGTEKHILLPEETLEYSKKFTMDKLKKSKLLILHFGAVDQVAQVSLNGINLGMHEGGYTSFSFDITDYVVEGENELKVKVRDYTDRVGYARGKQSLQPCGMWYSAQSGIWQTVWMEWVPEAYVTKLIMTPDIDNDCLNMVLKVSEMRGRVTIESSNPDLIKEYKIETITSDEIVVKVKLKDYKLWTPEEPNLYFLKVTYGRDSFSTYFAMRHFGVEQDENGIPRLTLNHVPTFMNGVLDQGYYPESLMTPPSDAAMIFDIETIKNMGFNMIRKHCKLEPMRWYFHCDRLGMIVWQDIVNGGTKYDMNMICNIPTIVRPFGNAKDKNKLFLRFTGRNTEKSKQVWHIECREIMEQLQSVPCIGQWCLFNEGWGQFDAKDCLKFAKDIDDTRPIDSASGWFHEDCGDVFSEHLYFEPLRVKITKRPYVISEYAGFSLKVGNHVKRDAVYGYKRYHQGKDLQDAYDEIMAKVKSLEEQGLSGAVFTQATDIEDEVNGLITYDRKVQKLY
ncbi:Glycosyl hydrolases family 2 [Pseudobutyrivibrio sp. YE44]|uniref:glycoside hydrolase family 2 protein n=1 Tax=Pseudobutyrivibrio sp. YE44 TaxID=1520802 RepID=UPI00088538FB|nr:sugar-binding domain-containing protein [Pseudobutyrivibrio sp. YE44]SDB55127.1 Glycosyl hydrolases family 2 [Pseudobutyrivibrio sp. YE44]